MKVKIFTEGGKSIGLGHLSRCMSLYEEVSKRDISIDFIINGDITNVGFLKDIKYVNENWMNEKYLSDYLSFDDYVIIDSYKAETKIYETIVEHSKKALFIDDIGRITYPKGIILNPTLDSSEIDYHEQSSIVLSGPEYIIVRQPFSGVNREKTNDEINRVLITMGGTDIRELTPLLIKCVCNHRKDIEFDIVIGSEEAIDPTNQLYYNSNVSIHTNINATQMKELMLNADLAITAAGQTIYELLATQTPFIPIKIIENQENNIRSLLKYNPKQMVLKYNDERLMDNVLKTLKIYDSGAYRREQIQYYFAIVDGFGPSRIIDKLIED